MSAVLMVFLQVAVETSVFRFTGSP
jgi:hypothetical protein